MRESAPGSEATTRSREPTSASVGVYRLSLPTSTTSALAAFSPLETETRDHRKETSPTVQFSTPSGNGTSGWSTMGRCGSHMPAICVAARRDWEEWTGVVLQRYFLLLLA